MREKLSDFLNVDLARLNFAGWLLMLAALGTVGGGVALFALSAEGPGEGGPRLPRWVAYLSWVAGALLFFGGRWALDALGVGVYRRPAGAEPKPGPAGESAAVPGGQETGRASGAAGRWVLAVLFALGAASFAVLGGLYGEYFPKGPWPFYGLAAVCALLAVGCLLARRGPGAP